MHYALLKMHNAQCIIEVKTLTEFCKIKEGRVSLLKQNQHGKMKNREKGICKGDIL